MDSLKKCVVAATHNKGKLNELKRILLPYGVEVILPHDESVLDEVEENGVTFSENALIKARAVFNSCGLPTIADDSGLCIDALGGRPGVYSARYLGEDTPYNEKLAGIIEELKDVPEFQRTARFECAIAFIDGKTEKVFSGSCEGAIGYEPRGDKGFGYDPIFYINGVSFSELSNAEKDDISHRATALKQLADNINDLL